MIYLLRCNLRADDQRDIIERRWEEHSAVTAPLLDFYRERGRLWDFQVKKGVQDTDDLIDLMKSIIAKSV
jgi:adenylate kinase family enzyme